MNLFGFQITRRPKKEDVLSEKLAKNTNQANTEKGTRSTDEQRLNTLYASMYPNQSLVAKIRDIRKMDETDGHVKRIHHRTSHALTKGGLTLVNPSNNKRLARYWREYQTNLGLNDRGKLANDAKGIMMEGNLFLQLVLDQQYSRVVGAKRMPADTIRVLTDESGQLVARSAAYAQYDGLTGRDIATFAEWQMALVRLDPLNYDDLGELGRPFLDASRKVWRQMQMTLDDLVIRRRERAPMRTAHVLEGADDKVLAAYKQQVEGEQKAITTNYYLNRKGGVQAVQGDANLDQIADVSLLLDAFFSGTPAPKGLFGYADGLNRDILMDMKEEFYDELDVLQDLQSTAYRQGFNLHLLLQDINPDAFEWDVKFAERMTETPNQRMDRALKAAALGASRHTVLAIAGLDPQAEMELLKQEQAEADPYPLGIPPTVANPNPRVNITPGNAPKNESATGISHAQ